MLKPAQNFQFGTFVTSAPGVWPAVPVRRDGGGSRKSVFAAGSGEWAGRDFYRLPDLVVSRPVESRAVPALSVPPVQRALLPKLKFHWAKPVDHACIAALNGGILYSLWWSVFLYGGKDSAALFQSLVATVVPGLVVGGFIAAFMEDMVRVPLLERYVKPYLSKAVNAVGLQDTIKSLEGNQGLPDYEFVQWSYRLNAVEYELCTHLNVEERRELEETAQGRPLTPEETELKEHLDREIAASRKSFEREKRNLEQIGMALPASPDPDRVRERAVFTVDTRYLTFLASTAATIGAMTYVYGAPEWTDNARDLLTFVGINPFFGLTLGFFYYHVVYPNVWQRIVRPLMASFNRATGVNVFAGLSQELAIPEMERDKMIFDRGVHKVNKLGNLLQARALKLKARGRLNAEEKVRLEIWLNALTRQRELIANVAALMKKIDADHDYA